MPKDFRNWFKLKPKIEEVQLPYNFHVHSGEIWWCLLGVNTAIETDGKGNMSSRAVLVVKVFNKEHIWIVPITNSGFANKFHIRMNSSPEKSLAIISQVRTISTRRLSRFLGRIDPSDFSLVREGLVSLLTQNETPPNGGESHGPLGQ